MKVSQKVFVLSKKGIPTNFSCSPLRQTWIFSSVTKLGTLMAHLKLSIIILSSIYSTCCYKQLLHLNGLLSVTTKTQKQYQQVFRLLRELNLLLEPTEIIIDFKKPAIFAFKSEFPKAFVKECFFILRRPIGNKN